MYNSSKAERILTRLKINLGTGVLRTSNAGVPHLVIRKGTATYSICYFGKTRVLRVFSDYGSTGQERMDFKEGYQVVNWFRGF